MPCFPGPGLFGRVPFGHRPFQESRAGPYRGMLVQLHDGQLQPLVLELGHTLNAEQGVASQVEEVVVDAHTVQGQQVGPGIGDRPFHGRSRTGKGHVQVRTGLVRGGQGAPIDLATGGARQFLHRNEGAWLHVVGKKPGQMPAQVVGVHGFLGHVVGDQPFQARPVLPHGGHGRLHSGMFLQGRFHLAQFDAVATHLHLTVDPALVVELTVLQLHRPVAGAVKPSSRFVWVRYEPFGGQVVPADVAGGHAGSAQVQFAFLPRRNTFHPFIQHQ